MEPNFSSAIPSGSWGHSLKMPVALVLAAGLLISVLAAKTVQEGEAKRDQAAFEIAADQMIDEVDERITQQIQLVQSIEAFFHSSQDVERGEFATFVADALKRYDAVQSLGWVPRVKRAERAAVEAAARRDGYGGFRINERTADGKWIPAGDRDEYFPTFYVEPRPADERSVGLDQASQAVRREAMNLARDTGELAFSGRIELALAADHRTAVIAYAPVYSVHKVPDSMDERRRTLVGFAFGLVRPSHLLEALTRQRAKSAASNSDDLRVDIFDTTDPLQPTFLFSRGRDADKLSVRTPPDRSAHGGDIVRALVFGGRQWTFIARRAGGPQAIAWQTWAALVGTLLLTGILSAYLQTTLERARLVEEEVGLRTNELKLTNELLRASEDRIRALTDSIPVLIAYVDSDLVYRFANRRYMEIGFEPEEIVGKTMREVRGDEDFEKVRSYYERAALGDSVTFELSSVDRTGRNHVHVIDCTPDVTEEHVNGFYILARDVTDERRAEHQLDQFFAQSLTLMCAINFDGFLSRFNPHWKTVLGYDYDELIAKQFVELVHEDDRAKATSALESLVMGDDIVNLELRFLRMDGGECSILWNATYDESNMQIYATGHDITALKAIDRMKDEFVATVSHELRTPLTSIKGALGLIKAKATSMLPPEMTAMLDIAYRNCDRLVLLINDILDIEKIEAGKMEFHMRPRDVVPIVESAIVANQSYADQFGVKLMLAEKFAEGWVLADENRIMQVMNNLLSNAAKFSRTGGTVEVRIERRDDAVRLSVTDHGQGIPEEHRGRLFQKFSQVDSSDRRKVGGTGLGLSIVRAIVERHGGTVDYVSQVGSGTTFFVDLPVYPPSSRSINPQQVAAI